uniref:SWIM-type domain-containing protein n=1 Tax=Tanacetum cinerariifolium TaxID=118510 RepID=A0A6L2J7K0_TANCI|nr:hypothetical protein [Tanacetum cinerariifolium]
MPVFPGSSGLVYQNLPSYQQMHGFSENPVYVPRFLGYPMHDPQSDLANRKSKQVVGSLKHKKPSVFEKVKRLASKDESSESDEDEETTPVEKKNCKIRTFVSRIRPLIIIDGAHLKGGFLGTMYLAVAMDDFEERFSTLRNWLPSVANKLDMIGLEKWARVHSPVNLNTRICSCRQWKLSGLPYGHLIAVMRHLRQSSANQFAFSCFKTSVWRASYKEIIYDVGHPSEWEKPYGLITVLPPLMDKRPP